MSSMAVDELADVVPDPHPAWLAAYALGLAYSSMSPRQRVDELREASRERPEQLRVARRRLEHASVVDPGLRHEARCLLDRAAASDTPAALTRGCGPEAAGSRR